MWTSANTKEEYIVKLKLDSLLDVEADEGKKQLKLNVDKEALCRAEELDGCYALKTDLPREVASKETIHDRYKGLSEVEWAFRTQKTGYLQVRPIYVRKRERSIAHLLIVMLAYKMERYLRSAWEDLDITVKEGISRLAKITSNVIAIGEKRLVTVPRPDNACKELLKRVNVTLPEVLPYRETHVATRKKLNSLRKRK